MPFSEASSFSEAVLMSIRAPAFLASAFGSAFLASAFGVASAFFAGASVFFASFAGSAFWASAVPANARPSAARAARVSRYIFMGGAPLVGFGIAERAAPVYFMDEKKPRTLAGLS